MQAATVEVLVSKGGFNPPVALAIAEAMDMTLQSSQLVTVPLLDARLATFKSEMRDLRVEMNLRFSAMEKRMDERFDAAERRTDERFEAAERRTDERFEAAEKRTDERFHAAQKHLDERFAALIERTDGKFAAVDARFEAVERRMDDKFDAAEKRMDEKFAAADQKMESRFKAERAERGEQLQQMKTHLIFWIVGASTGTALLPKLVALLADVAANAGHAVP